MIKERRRIIIDFEVLSKANFWICCIKTKKIKNNKKINTAKGAILITVKNAKLNQIEELKLAKPNF